MKDYKSSETGGVAADSETGGVAVVKIEIYIGLHLGLDLANRNRVLRPPRISDSGWFKLSNQFTEVLRLEFTREK